MAQPGGREKWRFETLSVHGGYSPDPTTKAVAVPVRVDWFRELLLFKQLPGKLLRKCRITLHPPMDLAAFYDAPYDKAAGTAVVARLSAILADPA